MALLPIIITGGPGAGKTTLINALNQQGFTTFNEVSRTLIEQQSLLEEGILPWHDLPAFAKLCLTAMDEQKQTALPLSSQQPCFMDRAIPDICAYLEQANLPIDETYITHSRGYHSSVLFCQPEQRIYVQDEVRPYSFEQALEIHQQLVNTYQKLGYKVIDVPWGSVDSRVEFVKRWL